MPHQPSPARREQPTSEHGMRAHPVRNDKLPGGTLVTARPGRKRPTKAPRIWPAVGLGVALSLILPACNGASDSTDLTVEPGDGTTAVDTATPAENDELRDALPLMVLQEEDLPPGLQTVGEGFTTNEEIIEASPDPNAKRAELARWGRILSYSTTFQPGPDILPETPIRGINTSASLYETAEGAAESYAQAETEANDRDWQADNPNLLEFQQQRVELEGVADELLWLRLSGLSTSQEGIVVDDVILFRVGRERGFLRVLASAPGQDRDLLLDEVEGWLRTQVRRVDEVLAAGMQP